MQKEDSLLLWFRVPISRICSDMSFQTYQKTTKWRCRCQRAIHKTYFMKAYDFWSNNIWWLCRYRFYYIYWEPSFVFSFCVYDQLQRAPSIPPNNLLFPSFHRYRNTNNDFSLVPNFQYCLFFKRGNPYWCWHSKLGKYLDWIYKKNL